jgi:hypothetical protein
LPVAILVMNVLLREELTAEMLLHHKPVLRVLLPVTTEEDIALLVDVPGAPGPRSLDGPF